MNPLRTKHEINLEGVKYALRYELLDWARAQNELAAQGEKVALVPFGQGDFWTGEQDGLYRSAILLYVGLRRAVKGLTLDWITDRVTVENFIEVEEVLAAALEDFFQRISLMTEKQKAKTRAQANGLPHPGEASGQNFGPSPAMTSASAPESSGG